MNSPVSKSIMQRFFAALNTLIASKKIRGVNTYCRLNEIDRRNLQAQRKDLDRGWFQVGWLEPMVRDYGISARWLILGQGSMFE